MRSSGEVIVLFHLLFDRGRVTFDSVDSFIGSGSLLGAFPMCVSRAWCGKTIIVLMKQSVDQKHPAVLVLVPGRRA
jgi:hypothetical protein